MIKYNKIDGLYYIENVIDDIVAIIDNDDNPWKPITDSKNSRKVKHYGYIYNYKSFSTAKTTPIPDYLLPLVDILKYHMAKLELDNIEMNQCIINNYEKGQGISRHIDLIQFGSVIGCFTLGNSATMRFSNKEGKIYDIDVNPNSLYIMSGDARYHWTHEMLRNKGDRRISITFRNINDI
jgi:alkylated DNA repair dioxygenase AlkB